MQTGDIVVNDQGWQGEILQIKRGTRFGIQCLVEYASRREWESQLSLYVVVKKEKANANT